MYAYYSDRRYHKASAMKIRSENEKNLSIGAMRIDLMRTFQMPGQHGRGWKLEESELE